LRGIPRMFSGSAFVLHDVMCAAYDGRVVRVLKAVRG